MQTPRQSTSIVRPGLRRSGVLAVAAFVALGLGACAKRVAPDAQAQIPDVYQERHPVVLGDVATSLDVFLAPNRGLDHRQVADVKDFLSGYKSHGKGPLVATLPGGAPGGSVQHTLAEIRKVASANGVGQIRTAGGATHPTAASIRLSYSKLDARLVSKCGEWPHDMSGGSTMQSWENRPYYNHGCAYQSMMAAQVANPIDHVRGRPESPVDIGKRLADQSKINSALQ